MLNLEPPPAQLLKDANDFERAQRRGAAQLKCGVPRGWFVEAQHREEDTTDDDGYVRREFRYARILRTLPLPAGVSETDIKASYKDGTLEVRVPAATVAPETPTASTIPITTA